MSLQPQAVPPVPEETVQIARAILPKGNTCIHMRDALGTFFRDEDFLDLFSGEGQPAESAWRLALVMVMQYAEGLTDRQAADAVRTRIDWKYALSLEIKDPGFDFSVLSEFRGCLLALRGQSRGDRSTACALRGNHLSTAMQKLGAHNRMEAARCAEQKGWL